MPPPFFCITHEPCAWPLPDFMTIVGNGSYVPPRGFAMSEHYPELAVQSPYFGEYVVLYALRRRLLEQGAEGFVGVCHYRRFALPEPRGERRGFLYHVHPDVMQSLQPQDFYGDGETPILPIPVRFAGTILRQYDAHAITRDVLHFFGDAVDCGVIGNREAAEFLSGDTFMVGPSVAYMPVAWFTDIIGALEKVMARFHRHHYIQREGYDERSIAFCAERLQAMLLAKHVAAWTGKPPVYCHLTLLNPDAPHA